MTSFPMHNPPIVSGIYTLKHKTTGQVYVGQSVNLKRRYFEWKAVFSSKLGATNPLLNGAIQISNPEEWEYSVLIECPPEKLTSTENEVIRRLKEKNPGVCLNGTTPQPKGEMVERAEGSISLTEVIDENGQPMTHAQIAARLGVTKQAVKKRLGVWRKKGKNKFNIMEL